MSKKNLKEVKIEQKAFDLIEQKAKETGKTVDEVANEMVEKMEVPMMTEEASYLHILRVLNDIGRDIIGCSFNGDDLNIDGAEFLVIRNENDNNMRVICFINSIYPLSNTKGSIDGKTITFTYYSDKFKNSRTHLVSWLKMLLLERRNTIRKTMINTIVSGVSISKEFKEKNIKITERKENINNENGVYESGCLCFKNTKTNKDYELPFYFDNCNYLFMGFTTDGRVRISNTIVAGPNEYPKVDFINQVLELINKMDNI